MNRRWTARIANGACLASAMLWVLSLIASFLTFALNPWDHNVSPTPDFRIGVRGNGENWPDEGIDNLVDRHGFIAVFFFVSA